MGAVTADLRIGSVTACVETIVRDIEAEYARATTARRRMAIAVPGGSVGVHVFPALAALDLDWRRVDIFWVDERAVPPTEPESNYRLAEALWLRPAAVPQPSVHRMPAEHLEVDAAAVYAAELVRVLGPSGRLDVALLGVGPDGHVASLFPGHAALLETTRLVVALDDAPMPPPRRLTMTLRMLTSAGRVIVAAFGDSKAPLLTEALTDDNSPLPVARVLRGAPRPLVVADDAAAGGLKGYR